MIWFPFKLQRAVAISLSINLHFKRLMKLFSRRSNFVGCTRTDYFIFYYLQHNNQNGGFLAERWDQYSSVVAQFNPSSERYSSLPLECLCHCKFVERNLLSIGPFGKSNKDVRSLQNLLSQASISMQWLRFEKHLKWKFYGCERHFSRATNILSPRWGATNWR